MKKILRWVIGLLLVLLVAGLVLLLLKDTILKSVAERRIRQKTGLQATIGKLQLGLTSATLTIKDFKLYNSAEFGALTLLDVPEIYLELDAGQTAGRKFHFKHVRFSLAELNMIRNKDGRLNLDLLHRSMETNAPGITNQPGTRFEFAGIDQLHLTLGKLKYKDLQQPANNREIELGVKDEVLENVRTEEDLQKWLGAFLARLIYQEYFNNSGTAKAKALELLLEEIRK